MPRSLIDNGLADYVLRAEEMPEVLLKYARHPYTTGDGDGFEHKDEQDLREIVTILRARTRHDFGGYKKPTLMRRIQRRMGLNQVTRMSEYAKLLRQRPAEVTALSDDLMIHVTGFFRDPEAWETLREQVIKPLVEERANGSSIRAWVSACASGEEAYTLAMILSEEAQAAGKQFDVKIFATDATQRALNLARAGVFPGGIDPEKQIAWSLVFDALVSAPGGAHEDQQGADADGRDGDDGFVALEQVEDRPDARDL